MGFFVLLLATLHSALCEGKFFMTFVSLCEMCTLVRIEPRGNFTSTIGYNITFICSENRLANYTWLLNGDIFVEKDHPDIDLEVSQSLGFTAEFLVITNTSIRYNETTFQCKGRVRSGQVIYSSATYLLLQGRYQ